MADELVTAQGVPDTMVPVMGWGVMVNWLDETYTGFGKSKEEALISMTDLVLDLLGDSPDIITHINEQALAFPIVPGAGYWVTGGMMKWEQYNIEWNTELI